MIKSLKQLEPGLYQDAAQKNTTFSGLLAEMAYKGEVSPELIRVGEDQPKDSAGTPVSPLRQLLRKAGIRTRGPSADLGERFFSNPGNRVLFPEFIRETYYDHERMPLNEVTLGDLVRERVSSDSAVYKAGIIERDDREAAEGEFGRVSEGGELPEYTIRTADREIRIYKYGGILKMTYEALRRTRINVIARAITKIGLREERRKIKHALDVAVNGDGNSNPAITFELEESNWTLREHLRWQIAAMDNQAEIALAVGDETNVLELLSLVLPVDNAANQVPTSSAQAFVSQGSWPDIMGTLVKLAPVGSILRDPNDENPTLGVDRQFGLEEVVEAGSSITETDRLITTQFERIAITENIGYAKPDSASFYTAEKNEGS